MPTQYEIRPVDSSSLQKKFMSFIWDLYRGDENWIPPLRQNQLELVGFRPHPFYERNKIKTFLAYRDGVPAGRIAAIVNYGHVERYNENRGFFGFFDCINEQQVANLLFREAGLFLKSQGMDSVRGPANPSLNHEIGCLVEGFDTPPTFMMTYNPPYYDELIRGWGFEKVQDLYSYEADASMLDKLDPKMRFVIEEVKRRFNVQVRPINRKRFMDDVRIFLNIYNRSLEGTWGFVPMTENEVEHSAKGLKMLIEPDITSFIEVDGRTVGAGLGLLDYNPRIKEIDGRLFPFGFLKLLFGRKKLTRVRLMSTNVLPEFQRWGLGIVTLDRMLPDCLKRGITHAEFSWVLESNDLSRGSLERGGAKRAKTYRLYDRSLTDIS